MSAKVFIRSVDQKTTERAKRSKAESLLKQLLVVKISQFLYQRVAIHSHPHSPKVKHIGPKVYQHHIEPKLCRVNRREMEELERWLEFQPCE